MLFRFGCDESQVPRREARNLILSGSDTSDTENSDK
jgi:hypothetical protein